MRHDWKVFQVAPRIPLPTTNEIKHSPTCCSSLFDPGCSTSKTQRGAESRDWFCGRSKCSAGSLIGHHLDWLQFAVWMRGPVCLQVNGQVVGSRPQPGGGCQLERGQALAARLRLTCSFTAFTNSHSTCQFIDRGIYFYLLSPASLPAGKEESHHLIWVLSFFLEKSIFLVEVFFQINIIIWLLFCYFSYLAPGPLPWCTCYSLQLTNNLQLYSVGCCISAVSSNFFFFAVTFCDFAICRCGSWRTTQCALLCLWPSKPRALLQFGKWSQKCCKENTTKQNEKLWVMLSCKSLCHANVVDSSFLHVYIQFL